MKLFAELILLILTSTMMTLTHGSKLEHWHHPEIQDSIEPSALQSASRNPKIFGGVSNLCFGFYDFYNYVGT